MLQQPRENKGTMRVLLANPRGFCAGVNMAIESLERALELFGTPFYVYHEIVHNKLAILQVLRSEFVLIVYDGGCSVEQERHDTISFGYFV